MEQEFHQFLCALGDIQKGLELYSHGHRQEGDRIFNASLGTLDRVIKGPEWPSFFEQINAFFASLELVDLGVMEKSALMESGLLKKYGINAPELAQLTRFYRGIKEHGDAAGASALFAAPENLVAALRENLEAINIEVDKARSLPRRLKKNIKKIAGSRATHLLAGSMLIAANLFWQKEQQTSVSIGIIFLNSALKAK
jgi:hypothetical protein